MAPKPGKPGSIEHFEGYARLLVMEDETTWDIQDFQLEIVEELLFATAMPGVYEVWVIIPEGNGKTTLFAGFALYHADYTKSPWVPIGAASRDQAEILFGQAAGFIERTPGLGKRFHTYDGYRKIVSHRNGGRGIKVYAADQNTGDGAIPSLCLVDEPHRMRNLALYRTWKGKCKKRGAAIATISTAGEPGTDFEKTRDNIRNKATKRERKNQCHLRSEGSHIVMHEWQVPKAEMAKDLDVVLEANPLPAITREMLAETLASDTLDYGEDWLRRTCNIPSRSSHAAISDVDWDHAEVEDEIPAGAHIWCGADFAWVLDTTALAPLWIRDRTYRLFDRIKILVPPRDGTMLDPQEVKDAFEEINERNPIDFVVADKSKAEDTLLWVENELGVTVVDRTQAPQFASDDYERFMEGLRGGSEEQPKGEPRRESWIKHTGDPLFREHVMNAIARKLPGDRYRFDRPTPARTTTKQDHRVIDALTAASMVHSQAAANLNQGDVVPLVALGR